MSDSNRREFLIQSSCAMCVLAACGGDNTDPIDAGSVDDYATGVLKYVGGGVAVGQDDDGLYAMSTICTHSGCDIGVDGEVTQDRLTCGCHGSQFDSAGEVLQGPAASPLDFYELTVDEFGNLTVHPDISATPTDRLEA